MENVDLKGAAAPEIVWNVAVDVLNNWIVLVPYYITKKLLNYCEEIGF